MAVAAAAPRPATAPTAAIILIGNEILSGRIQDANVSFIAKHLATRGIAVHEVRVVRDVEAEIIAAVNSLRERVSYVFTTGGIGPTHDDITSATIAKAFGVSIAVHPEAKARLKSYYDRLGNELNEARLRMAMIPQGATLIDNPVSAAPGFKIGNVFVMAGVPKIMQAMMHHVDSMIEGGAPILSITLRCNQREGEIAFDLTEIQNSFHDVEIGSYPHLFQTPSLSLVLRGTDPARLESACARVAAMIEQRGEKPEIVR